MNVDSYAVPGDVIGVVLAGGLSRRLGQDKARLVLEGEDDLLTRTVKLLLELVPKVLVVGRKVPELELIPNVECIPDRKPGNGPLGGIAAALEHSGRDCLVLSCDLPFIAKEPLEKLLQQWGTRSPKTCMLAYEQEATRKIENLVAVYAQEALTFLQASMDSGLLKVSRAIDPESIQTIPYQKEQSRLFFNLNCPELSLIHI